MPDRPSSPAPTQGSSRPKLDARLAWLLTLSIDELVDLKHREAEELAAIADRLAALPSPTDERDADEQAELLRSPGYQPFAPLTTGVHLPGDPDLKQIGLGEISEPWFSAIVLTDAGSRDLAELGLRVRCQVCDLFTTLVPASAMERLEALTALQYVELARPWFWDLGQAIPFTGINTVHGAAPPVTGTNVVVGVIDNPIDVYHPDFRTAAGATRLLFLWDQLLVPAAGEAGPPTAPALPGFTPAGGVTYGVEYPQAMINAELNAFNPPATPAYQTVRHQPPAPPINGSNGHGTFVTGAAAGNGLGGGSVGGAPGANIIFVRPLGVAGVNLAADNVSVLDAFSYIFARATQAGQASVVNLSASDNQGPHDGTALGEQFLDGLLLTPGRAITLSAGNSTGTNAHAAGTVAPGGTANLVLAYAAGATRSDDVEIWYDGHDQFTVTITAPTVPATIIGPVAPGAVANTVLPNGVTVQVTSVLNDPRNGDNLISIIITVPGGQSIPPGNWTIALTGTVVINGAFNAWVDRNNRFLSAWQAPFVQETQLTLGVPSTAKRAITVGNHDKTAPTPAISPSSGLGPARDGRVKPDSVTVGTNLTAASPRNMNSPLAGQPLYQPVSGTSFSAPLVAGACALLFQCRGAAATWADLKQVLTDTAGTVGLAIPSVAFGFGFLQMAAACARPPTNVDVWVRDAPGDGGAEPFTGPVFWASPDIAVLDTAGNPVANPTYSAVNRFNNIIRVTVRNLGTQTARNVEVYLYWADPGTNIPFPAQWRSVGIFTGPPGFLNLGNVVVVPQLGPGGSTTVDFGWAPPAPGSNLQGDNHFCLLARLEHDADPSNVGAGGFASIPATNNLGLRNVGVL
jgi:Subtilase family